MTPDQFIEKKFCAGDGITSVYWVKEGRPDKPALFFIHGLGGNSTAWKGVIRSLANNDLTMLCIDLRCHGLSDMPSSGKYYGIDKIADDINGVIEKENIRSYIPVAHSFGGVCVLTALLNGGGGAAGAVLCNTPYKNPYRHSPNFFVKRSAPLLKVLLRAAAAGGVMRRKKYPYPDYYALRHLSETGLWLHDISAAPLRAFFNNYLLMFSLDFDEKELASLPHDFLLFTSDDPFVAKESLYDLSKILKTWKIVEIKGCDHETIIRNSGDVAAELDLFIAYILKKQNGSCV